MGRRFAIVYICLLACVFDYSHASDAHLLKHSFIEEFIDSKEQISGNSTLGAIYFSEKDQVREDRLYALINKSTTGNLVLRINSIDGRYSSEIHYKLESPTVGWVQLEFPTQHRDFVRKYSTSELAGLLMDINQQRLYPLRWGSDERSKVVRLYINSERARAYFIYKENGKKRITYCKKPSRSSGFKFNSICDVPLAAISKQSKLNIHRKFGVRTLDPISVELSL
ncbi:MAG: hypothetical protein ABW092_17760 [Candidatus Thiodiazotropha sp.]